MSVKKLACGCELSEPFEIPPHLETQPPKILRQLANAHGIGPTGAKGDGFSRWRHGANGEALLKALLAHKSGQIIPPAADGPGIPGMENFPDLLDEMDELLQTVNPELISKLIEKRVLEEVAKHSSAFQQVQVTFADGTEQMLESQHKSFPTLLRAMATGVNIMLVGPAGSGKTEAAVASAKALQKDFEIISVGPQTMQSELSGYKNAHGDYIDSAIRRAFEHGRLLIIDEIDAGNAGVFTFTNATLSNSVAGYPDGPAFRHKDFQVVACANTYGTGADMVYIGRSQLDGATLDRYCTMVWDYDHEFEMKLALQHNTEAVEWVKQVQRWRENCMKHKIRHIISPRASIYGAKLMRVGFTVEQLAQMLVFKGLNKEAKDKILQGV